MRAPGRRSAASCVAATVAALLAGLIAAPAPAAPEQPDVMLVTFDCAGNFLCPAFAGALRDTGVTGRIISPDVRQDPVAGCGRTRSAAH